MSLHKPTVFTGAATALITPFRDGKIDRAALAGLIEFQIAGRHRGNSRCRHHRRERHAGF